MAETQVKRGRGRPKKVQQDVVKQDVITQEDIQKALEEIVDTKLEQYGVTKHVIEEEPTISDIDMVALMHSMLFDNDVQSSPITLEWQPIFNILTRMYESNDSEYNNVRYNKRDDNIIVVLDKNIFKSVDTELIRIKNAICSDALKYEGMFNDEKLMITIRKK